METKVFRYLFIGYVVFALLGASILEIDIMRTRHILFIDQVFTAASAISITGLTTLNVANDYTVYGQAVILLLVQIGGFGYMSMASLIFLIIGKRLDFGERSMLKEDLVYPNFRGIIKFIKKIFSFIIVIELAGAIVLTLVFMLDMPFYEALWSGVFHSISAFNNAGFSVFENSFMGYHDNLILKLTISSLVTLGGLGYLVLNECYSFYKKQQKRLSVHTRIVLIMSVSLFLISFFVITVLEFHHDEVFKNFDVYEKLLAFFFVAVNLRTSGFNSIDVSQLHDQTIFFSTLMMIIGAAPGGTGGGMKVTTLAVLLLFTYSVLKDRDPVIFKRKITSETIRKAFVIFVASMVYVVISVMIIGTLEDKNNEKFLPILFEVSSAFSTTGMSLGSSDGSSSLVGDFDVFGKLYIIVLMFMGRIGVLAFSFMLLNKNKKSKIEYPTEEVNL